MAEPAQSDDALAVSFTVIIPWHRDRECLRRAVASVQAQTYAPSETLIVCNGVAAAEIDSVTAEFRTDDTRILFLAAANANAARNLGADHAVGTYCAFLDADDEFASDKLAIVKRHLDETRQPIAISRGTRLTSGGRAWPFPKRGPTAGERLARYFFSDGNFISTSAIVAATHICRSVRFDEAVTKFQDLDFLMRAQAQGFEIGFIEDALYTYHDTPSPTRLSRGRCFEDHAGWANAYPHFDAQDRAAFAARAIAQHDLPRRPLRNLSAIVQAAGSGALPLSHAAALALRGFVPASVYESLLRHYNSKHRDALGQATGKARA